MDRKLDLRTGKPVWSAYRAPTVPSTKLVRDIRADVLIVGAGITGAMAADMLAGTGRSVVMIDRRGPIRGSTAATTALVQYEIDIPLSLLAGKIGTDKAQQAWRRSRLAVAALGERIRERSIACNLRGRDSLYLAGNVLSPDGLRGEAAARRAAGLDASYLPPTDLRERFGLDRKGAVLSHGNFALDPRKLVAGLLIGALDAGARLYCPVEATAFEAGADEVSVATGSGPVIRAGMVVLATGYELTGIVPASRHRIISTWAIATKRQPKAIHADQPLIWEASEPYLYLRPTDDGRIICGGEDEDFSDEERRDSLIGEKTSRIVEKLQALLPQIDATPEFAWTGSFGTTATGLPIIGPIPRHPRLFAVLGYGGNGITFSRIAAEMLRTTLDGGEDRDAGLFAFPR